jgi:nicotinamidase-related amidase
VILDRGADAFRWALLLFRSAEGLRAALERITQAGAKPVSWVQLICELQRDWQRKATAKEFANILFAVEGH